MINFCEFFYFSIVQFWFISPHKYVHHDNERALRLLIFEIFYQFFALWGGFKAHLLFIYCMFTILSLIWLHMSATHRIDLTHDCNILLCKDQTTSIFKHIFWKILNVVHFVRGGSFLEHSIPCSFAVITGMYIVFSLFKGTPQ